MMDREKVISGLKNRSIVIRWLDVIVKDNWMWDHADAYAMVCKAALELLKEREPVPAEMEGGVSTWWYVCGECHGAIDYKDPFCRHCGTEVEWNA